MIQNSQKLKAKINTKQLLRKALSLHPKKIQQLRKSLSFKKSQVTDFANSILPPRQSNQMPDSKSGQKMQPRLPLREGELQMITSAGKEWMVCPQQKQSIHIHNKRKAHSKQCEHRVRTKTEPQTDPCTLIHPPQTLKNRQEVWKRLKSTVQAEQLKKVHKNKVRAAPILSLRLGGRSQEREPPSGMFLIPEKDKRLLRREDSISSRRQRSSQSQDREGERALKNLIRYEPQSYGRVVNSLALNLHINLEHSKRNRIKTTL